MSDIRLFLFVKSLTEDFDLRVLKGEAVRMVRQLPLNQSRDDVENTLNRMREQLGKQTQSCIHGRPFLHLLTRVPETEEEALVTLANA